MTDFNSPLGKKTFASSSNPKIFEIPDETEHEARLASPQAAFQAVPQGSVPDPSKWQPGVAVQLTPEQFNAMMAQRQQVKEDTKKVSQFSRDRINILTNIGRVKKQLVIDEHTFTLRSLKDKEVKEIFTSLEDVKNASQLALSLRTLYLAHSLCEIDGHPVGDVLGDNSLETIVLFLQESEDYLISLLYDKYNEMVNELKKKFSVTTDEKSEEVLEDIKKS